MIRYRCSVDIAATGVPPATTKDDGGADFMVNVVQALSAAFGGMPIDIERLEVTLLEPES